ncbi:choice-of-anchor K domain-containing protein [Parafrankia discariae]|uniref:choice-of-anchor K domain-containing protein n=1 Tax=Parafrankia discariae TaxID=365528 RepID=UPI0003604FBE|nr:choice-of-anchor K domain-containing protein [Parafrankia discariae]
MTSGRWTRVSVDDLPGLTFRQESDGRSEVRWGEPLYGGAGSGYDFEGCATDAPVDGTDFPLGRFTHHNRRIQLPTRWQFWVYLTVSVYFEDVGIGHDLTVRFRHEEIPNQGAHPNDVIPLPKVHANGLVHLDGIEHRVTITGFLLGQGSRRGRVSTFDVPEGSSISAGLLARFERTAES